MDVSPVVEMAEAAVNRLSKTLVGSFCANGKQSSRNPAAVTEQYVKIRRLTGF